MYKYKNVEGYLTGEDNTVHKKVASNKEVGFIIAYMLDSRGHREKLKMKKTAKSSRIMFVKPEMCIFFTR